MKTPTLIEVPRDHPNRKQLLDDFKHRHQIATNHAFGMDWMACHMPSARKLGYGVTDQSSLFECFSKVGRLIDEAGYSAYADTERNAVAKLCQQLHISVFPK